MYRLRMRLTLPIRHTHKLHCCVQRTASRVQCTASPNEGDAPPEPPLKGPFVRQTPLITYERAVKRTCRVCKDCGNIDCADCDGRGNLPTGGYHQSNPVSGARILNSKWTALQRTFGWRHFQVSQKRKEGKDTFVMLVATCNNSTQLWINMKNLKDRSRWASGWLQKQEIRAMESQAGSGAACKTCGGTGKVACPVCSLAGEIVEL